MNGVLLRMTHAAKAIWLLDYIVLIFIRKERGNKQMEIISNLKNITVLYFPCNRTLDKYNDQPISMEITKLASHLKKGMG